MKDEPKIFIYDLETTGADPEVDRIVQIAYMIVTESFEFVTSGTALVNPGTAISPDATGVHGITQEMVADAPAFRIIAPAIKDLLDTCQCIGGYNNKSFDNLILERELELCNIVVDLNAMPNVDVYKLWHHVEPRTLEAAYKRYTGRELEGAHDALNDVNATRAVLEAIMARNRDIDLTKINELLYPDEVDRHGKLKRLEDGSVALTFGKYRDTPLDDVPVNYLSWLLKSDFPLDTKKHIKKIKGWV